MNRGRIDGARRPRPAVAGAAGAGGSPGRIGQRKLGRVMVPIRVGRLPVAKGGSRRGGQGDERDRGVLHCEYDGYLSPYGRLV